MTTIVFPDNTKDIIDSIRAAIGRDIELRYISSVIPCSACSLDPVTGSSDDSFCEVCSGIYYIPTISGYTVGAVITWSPSDRLGWEMGGTLAEGDCVVQIELTDTVQELLLKTEEVVVDGKIMEIKKKMRRGVKAQNRILLSLIEKE